MTPGRPLKDLPPGAPPEAEGVLFSESEISARVADMGRRITADYMGRDLLLVTLLRGGVFFMTDLAREIDLPLKMDFMAISAYTHGASGGAVRITKDLEEDVAGASILICEDIIDTGLTLNYLIGVLKARNPASVEVAVLLDRDARRIANLPIAYRGFQMEDRFVVGYGLDLWGRYRNVRYIAALHEGVAE